MAAGSRAITPLAELEALDERPAGASLVQEIDYISDHYRAFIEKASQNPAGALNSAFEITDARLEGERARITAKESRAGGAGPYTEEWVIEEELWCLKKQL